MKDFIPFIGTRTARDAVDDVFSREVLGSILLGLSTGKVVEQLVLMAGSTAGARFVIWIGASGVFFTAFVYWDRIENRLAAEIGVSDPLDPDGPGEAQNSSSSSLESGGVDAGK